MLRLHLHGDSPASGCPLTSKVLDVLHWPHKDVTQELGFIDPTILTYQSLSSYGFFDLLQSGEVRSRNLYHSTRDSALTCSDLDLLQ